MIYILHKPFGLNAENRNFSLGIFLSRYNQKNIIIPFLTKIIFPLLRIKLTVIGDFPSSGSYLFVSNHCSHIDTVALLGSMPRELQKRSFIAASESYFFKSKNPLCKIATKVFNLIPVSPRSTHFCHTANKLKSDGKSMIIFPEGTRSRTGLIGKFRSGAGYISTHNNIPIIPITINGSYKVMKRGSIIPRPGKITVIINEPILPNKKSAEDITNIIKSKITEDLC